jgi:hypothetical protein
MMRHVVILSSVLLLASSISCYVALAQPAKETKSTTAGLMDRVSKLEQQIRSTKDLALSETRLSMFSGGFESGDKWVQAEVWNSLGSKKLGLPDKATIVGAWVTFEGEYDALKNSNRAGVYDFPIVQVAVRRELVSLRPLDIKDKSYRQDIILHCVYQTP